MFTLIRFTCTVWCSQTQHYYWHYQRDIHELHVYHQGGFELSFALLLWTILFFLSLVGNSNTHTVSNTLGVLQLICTHHIHFYTGWMCGWFFFSSYLLFFNSQSRMQEIKSLKLHIFQVKDPKLFLCVCLNSTASWRGVHNNLSTPMPVIQNSAVLDFMTLHMNLI